MYMCIYKVHIHLHVYIQRTNIRMYAKKTSTYVNMQRHLPKSQRAGASWQAIAFELRVPACCRSLCALPSRRPVWVCECGHTCVGE